MKTTIFKEKNVKKKFCKQQGHPITTIYLKQIKTKVEKKYKDTVFTKLFNNKAAAIQLYNALHHKNLPKDTYVEIVTLDDTLFKKRKNDVAFIIDGHFLIFVEHQSTINENMPLRLLFYVVQEYEKFFGYTIIKGKQVSHPLLYKKEQIKIPKPEFFVLYNGMTNLTEVTAKGITNVTEKLMKLSDAFIEDNKNPNSLELCVKLIDIRYDKHHQSLYQVSQNTETKENLSLLGEYSYFINKITEYKQNNSLEEAIKVATKHCIEERILKDFLLKNETEVIAMLLGTYSEEIEKQVLCEEAEARGVKIGEARGEARGVKIGEIKGIRTLIDTLLDLGYPNNEILSILQKKLKVTKQQADQYLKNFYDGTL